MQNLRSIYLGLALAAGACFVASAQQPVSPSPQNPQQPAPNSNPAGKNGTSSPSQARGPMNKPNGGGRQFGVVTEAAGDHFTIKTDNDLCKILFSAETPINGQPPPGSSPHPQGPNNEGSSTSPKGPAARFTLPSLTPADIKVGDSLLAFGDFNASTHTLTANRITRIDADRARVMRDNRDNYGKIWLAGKLTAIEGQKLTVMSPFDSSPISFVVDGNTAFRKRHLPITLADYHVGDMIRAEGLVKGPTFYAEILNLTSYPASELFPKTNTPTAPATPKPTE